MGESLGESLGHAAVQCTRAAQGESAAAAQLPAGGGAAGFRTSSPFDLVGVQPHPTSTRARHSRRGTLVGGFVWRTHTRPGRAELRPRLEITGSCRFGKTTRSMAIKNSCGLNRQHTQVKGGRANKQQTCLGGTPNGSCNADVDLRGGLPSGHCPALIGVHISILIDTD